MNRLGWAFVALIAIAGLAISILSTFGVDAPPEPRAEPAAPQPVKQTAAPGRFVPKLRVPDREAVSSGGMLVPVVGVTAAGLRDSFTEARGGGTRIHDALDIMAPRGTPVVAAAAGSVEKIFESKNGGHTVYVRTLDRRHIHYYAHLDRYADGLAEGQRLARGAAIGTVGSTGSASPDGPHLHFAVNVMKPGERRYQGTPVNPYPLLAGNGAAR